MNRRAFVTGMLSVLPCGAATVIVATKEARKAIQVVAPQCPQCLDILYVVVPREPAARRAWTESGSHTMECPRCRIDVTMKLTL